MSKKLAAALSLPLTLHYSLAPQLKVVKSKDPERHKYDNLPPEVALVATVVVVLRLVYGLDGKERYGDGWSYVRFLHMIPGVREAQKILPALSPYCKSTWNS
jgi:hypothetical protein